jgi:eukaryotic-like serine/threonine-protein kinase
VPSEFAAGLAAAGITLLVAVAIPGGRVEAPLHAPADRWAQFRGTPPLTGASDARLPDSLKVRWTYDAGDVIESSAAIVDGVVYVGSATGELHALNLGDGSVRWKYKASSAGIGESSPTVSGGLVYIGDLDGVLHAVDVSSGKAAWTFKTGTEIKSSPVVVDDKVLIGSYDAHLYAVNAKTGTVVWKVRTDGYVHATPAVLDGVAYITG